LQLPGMVEDDGQPKYPGGFPQYMAQHERAPGIGLLAGWRGSDGSEEGKGPPNAQQLDRYIEHGCFWHQPIPEAGRYYKMANRDYLSWSRSLGFVASTDPVVLQIYSETLQKFRLAAQGHGAQQPPASERERVARYFDPIPFWYAPLEWQASTSAGDYPLSAITQRPMFMYHSWGSQNAWLRQIAARNFLHMHPDTAIALGFDDGDEVWIESMHGRVRAAVKRHIGVEPGTVWTWNAIGKRKGAWKLSADAPESTDGFLLNQVISDALPATAAQAQYANADPVTGQAAWFDLRVRLRRASPVDAAADREA
jgi:sulfite dehydrogenase (quinone) subunit SoeA